MLLPPNDVEQEKPNGLPIKIVNIVKGSEPLGATIKAYPNGEIYVARVIVGGAADRCGSIQVSLFYSILLYRYSNVFY
jgi:hypothetical protein